MRTTKLQLITNSLLSAEQPNSKQSSSSTSDPRPLTSVNSVNYFLVQFISFMPKYINKYIVSLTAKEKVTDGVFFFGCTFAEAPSDQALYAPLTPPDAAADRLLAAGKKGLLILVFSSTLWCLDSALLFTPLRRWSGLLLLECRVDPHKVIFRRV